MKSAPFNSMEIRHSSEQPLDYCSLVLRASPLKGVCLHEPPNGWRYPLVGGTRQRHFDGTNLKPRKLPENAQTPTSRVHAVLGGFTERKTLSLKQDLYP